MFMELNNLEIAELLESRLGSMSCFGTNTFSSF